MTYKDMFDQAFDSLGNSKMRMTDSEFSAAVRAKAKKNTAVVGNGMTLREIPVSREPHRQHRLRNAVFGIAGTAAVLTGAVFGLKFLNEHGGLKEGGIDTDTSTGAGYSQNVTAEPEDTTAVMPAGSEMSDDIAQPDIDSAEKKEYEAQLKELNDTKEYYENEFEALESAKKEEALTITYLTQEKEKLTEELTRLQLLGEDTSAVEQDIKSVEEKIGQHEILLDSFSEEAEKIYDKLGVVKMQIAKIEAEMKGHIFYEFGDDEPEVTEETTVTAVLPDITGLNIEDAKEILENAHINYSITRHASDEVPENCVIRTLPQAGAEINSSVIVSISVSSSVPAVFDDFAAAGEVYGHDFIDFGVNAKVRVSNVFGCEIIQASKYMENVQFNEDGTIGGEVTTIGSPNESRGSIKPEFHTQTVILADTLEERMNGFKNMISNNIEDCEHESYYSEKLGLTVDVYYGRTGNVSNGLGTENITSVAVFDDGDVLYILSIENTACLADVETAARKVTDYDQKNGYYEGEEALNILKQYAGEDYCFPLENWTKEVINYRTRDEWTGDTSTDYRFNIPAEEGEPILAVTGGTVIETNPENVPGQGEGIYITIQAADGRKWRYSHLSDIYVSEGDIVKAGSRIAAVGATGWCTGSLVCISFPDSEVIDPAETTE